MDQSDFSAIRAVLAGDTDAYQALVLRHTPMLFRLAFRITASEADADEAVQDAFLRAFQKLPSFGFQSAFSTWLYRIAANSAYDSARRRHSKSAPEAATASSGDRPTEKADASAGPERLLLSQEFAAIHEFALHSLTPLERSAFVLRHIEGQPTSEIAAALAIAPNAAKQAIFRATQKLRVRLAPLRSQR